MYNRLVRLSIGAGLRWIGGEGKAVATSVSCLDLAFLLTLAFVRFITHAAAGDFLNFSWFQARVLRRIVDRCPPPARSASPTRRGKDIETRHVRCTAQLTAGVNAYRYS